MRRGDRLGGRARSPAAPPARSSGVEADLERGVGQHVEQGNCRASIARVIAMPRKKASSDMASATSANRCSLVAEAAADVGVHLKPPARRRSARRARVSRVAVSNCAACTRASASSQRCSGGSGHAGQHGALQRLARAGERFVAVATMDDQLGQQRIVVRRHPVAGIQVAVHSHALALRPFQALHGAGAGEEIARRVFGVDPHLQRRAVQANVLLAPGQRLAGGDAQHGLTRSMPVTISLTGCSTWIRVFISMKKNSPLCASNRYSRVPAPR